MDKPSSSAKERKLLFWVLGVFFQCYALGVWFFEVSCHGSTKYGPGGCLFGQDAKTAALLISWLGAVWFLPLVFGLNLLRLAVVIWFFGIMGFLFFVVLAQPLGL